MGRPGVMRKPDLKVAEHREFNEALHELHLMAGRPSLTKIARELRGAGISRSSVHDAFSSRRLPQWTVVEALTEVLASLAPRTTAEQQITPMHELWVRASRATDEGMDVPPPLPLSAPVEKLILLLEAAQFGSLDDFEQLRVHRAVVDIADYALTAAGVGEHQRHREDRGDGVLVLIDPRASTAVLESVLLQAPERLRAVNGRAAGGTSISLRGVLAFGDVGDERSWRGHELTRAYRVLDSEVLRGAVRESGNGFALALTDPVYEDLVRHNVEAAFFRKEQLHTKEGPLTAWVADSL